MNRFLNEAIAVAQNRPLWRLMSASGAMHSQWCMPQMNEWMTSTKLYHLMTEAHVSMDN